jgi:glucosamine-6-phosphate deaminase
MTGDIQTFPVDKLTVKIYPDRMVMGKTAGQAVASKMSEILKKRKTLSMVFAAAPSQNEFLQELSGIQKIDWNRVVAFHLDEYLGLPGASPQSFGNFLRSRLFERVRPGKVHYLNGMADHPEAECERYARLLKKHPLNIACIGIGENGHIAFNDPPVADFDDPLAVRVVDLDLTSRQQQVNDGCFQELERVPKRAITLTIPAIFAARFIYCIVPAPSKAEAVRKTLKGSISTECPASILRKHEYAILFLDPHSASRVLNRK